LALQTGRNCIVYSFQQPLQFFTALGDLVFELGDSDAIL
jgi:hypothetical protein